MEIYHLANEEVVVSLVVGVVTGIAIAAATGERGSRVRRMGRILRRKILSG
jgi:transcription antitermination factor NusA-like protein